MLLSKISHLIFDPYGDITKKHLGGPFWDSIYNVTSIFYGLFKQAASFNSVLITKDSVNVFEAEVTYKLASTSNTISQTISIRWDLPVNLKISHLMLDKKTYIIDHSSQSVTQADGLNHRFVMFEAARLEAHYGAVIEDALNYNSLNKNLAITKVLSDIVWKIADAKQTFRKNNH